MSNPPVMYKNFESVVNSPPEESIDMDEELSDEE